MRLELFKFSKFPAISYFNSTLKLYPHNVIILLVLLLFIFMLIKFIIKFSITYYEFESLNHVGNINLGIKSMQGIGLLVSYLQVRIFLSIKSHVETEIFPFSVFDHCVDFFALTSFHCIFGFFTHYIMHILAPSFTHCGP